MFEMSVRTALRSTVPPPSSIPNCVILANNSVKHRYTYVSTRSTTPSTPSVAHPAVHHYADKHQPLRGCHFQGKVIIIAKHGAKLEIPDGAVIANKVIPDMILQLESAGLSFVGKDETTKRMEIVELHGHPFFIGAQFHPEFKSRPGKPSPLF